MDRGRPFLASFSRVESFAEPHAVLGNGHGRVLSGSRTDGRIICALVRIFGVLSAVSIAWADVAFTIAVGLEHRRTGTIGTRDRTGCERASQRAGGTDLPKISRAALSHAAVQLFAGARSLRHRDADDARALAA